jgi:hypothetical protein
VDTVGLDPKFWKHIAALLAALVAILVTFKQANTAKKKSRDQDSFHATLKGPADTTPSPTDTTPSQAHISLMAVLEDDVKHFSRVGTWWFVGLAGAGAALFAEILDWIAE